MESLIKDLDKEMTEVEVIVKPHSEGDVDVDASEEFGMESPHLLAIYVVMEASAAAFTVMNMMIGVICCDNQQTKCDKR